MVLLPMAGIAQDQGTYFEHGLSWSEVKEKAKSENKYLFVDCFTTWCGPCKHMTNTIFPQEEVGKFFNTNFVNVKVQMDETDQDNEEVKSWRADAKAIAEEYSVRAYPTFLVFSPDGEIVHRLVGGGEAAQFIARAKEALQPETQYYTQLRKYDAGERSPEFLKNMALSAQSAYDMENASKMAEAYLETQTDLYTEGNLEFLAKTTRSSKDKGFDIFLNNSDKVNAVLGEGKASDLVASIVMQEEVYAKLRGEDVNFAAVINEAKAKYPKVDISKQSEMLEIQWYQRNKDWANFQPAVLGYMEKYGSEVSPQMLNSFAWAVFENCEDPSCVASAIAWSKRSVDETERKNPTFLDTYANLLYKSGSIEEAIAYQQQAVDLAPDGEKETYQATLEKMKNGDSTWKTEQ